jgi:hypothetical protein
MAISLSPNQARNIAAGRSLFVGRMRRPIQTNEIKDCWSNTWLPPFAETRDKTTRGCRCGRLFPLGMRESRGVGLSN